MKTILIIEDDIVFSRSISNWLVKKGMKTECVATLANARKAIGQKEFDLILADLRLPDGNSTSLLKWMNEKYYSIPFLIMTNYGQVENAVTTMQLGAINYLCKPVQPDNLLALITEILDKNDNEQEFYRGESPKAHEMYRLIEMIACADISVLLRGASGTGKEHIAAEIHARSHRKNKPYLAIDCGAISDELAASEFFGHQKGAFTGAESDKVGLFRAVNGGTLFLDEIGNLSYKTQMLLLRALQEKRCKPVGSTKEYSFDIRLVAATNENLSNSMQNGSFRSDLYYRLNVININIPPLRERIEDLPVLCSSMLSQKEGLYHQSRLHMSQEAMDLLNLHTWPGNVRELRALVQSLATMSEEETITMQDLPQYMQAQSPLPQGSVSFRQPMREAVAELERNMIMTALTETGSTYKAARRLKVSQSTIVRKAQRYKIGLVEIAHK